MRVVYSLRMLCVGNLVRSSRRIRFLHFAMYRKFTIGILLASNTTQSYSKIVMGHGIVRRQLYRSLKRLNRLGKALFRNQ